MNNGIMSRIFISYAREDEAFARALATQLAKLGADIWIDIEDIPAGVKWSTAIQQGLDIADGMIVIISPESMSSRNVEDEWQYLLDQNKPVIPVLLRPAKIHFQLNRIQWIDFQNYPFDVALVELHEELGRNGIHLQAPPRPDSDSPPLTHGHASTTNPASSAETLVTSRPKPTPTIQPQPQASDNSNNRNMLVVGGIIGAIVLVGFIALLINVLNGRDLLDDEDLTATTYVTEVVNVATATVASQVENSPTATRTIVPTTSTPTTPAINLGPILDNNDWQIVERLIDGVAMALVPSGRFNLGVTQEHYEQNLAVCISRLGEESCLEQLGDEFNGADIVINAPYWIDVYEVSEAVYGSSSRDLPQVNVTSAEAQSHCEARGGNLPNEVEWEFAAKGPSGWRYPWGNRWDLSEQRANICDRNCQQNWRESNYDDRYAEAAPVFELHSGMSWVGAFNMAGNVWEWTSDPYAPNTTNTLRGGAWTWIQGEATTTSRSDGIAERTDFYGFRCVRPYVDGDLERYSQ